MKCYCHSLSISLLEGSPMKGYKAKVKQQRHGGNQVNPEIEETQDII